MKIPLFPWLASFTVLLAVSIVPWRAEAFDTSKKYQVYLLNGAEKVDVGKLTSQLNQYVDANGYEACSYFASWNSAAGQPCPTQLFFDELLAPGYMDCEINAVTSFRSMIVVSPGFESSGVDKFQMDQTINSMVLNEDGLGCALGVVTYNTNFPYPLFMQPSSDENKQQDGDQQGGDQQGGDQQGGNQQGDDQQDDQKDNPCGFP